MTFLVSCNQVNVCQFVVATSDRFRNMLLNMEPSFPVVLSQMRAGFVVSFSVLCKL